MKVKVPLVPWYLCIAAFLLSQLFLQVLLYLCESRQFFAVLFHLQTKTVQLSLETEYIYLTLCVFMRSNTEIVS